MLENLTPKEESLIKDIKDISKDSEFLSNLVEKLKDGRFSKVDIVGGEHIDSKGNNCNECCLDVYIYDDKQMYMLTIYSDAIFLLKELIVEVDKDFKDLMEIPLEKSILPTLRMVA